MKRLSLSYLKRFFLVSDNESSLLLNIQKTSSWRGLEASVPSFLHLCWKSLSHVDVFLRQQKKNPLPTCFLSLNNVPPSPSPFQPKMAKKGWKKYSFPITLLHLPVKIWFNADTVTELYILTPPLTNSSRARPCTPLRFTGASERTFRITKPIDIDAERLWITICISICSKRASLLFGFLQ